MARAEYDFVTQVIVVKEGTGTQEKELARFKVVASGIYQQIQKVGGIGLHWRKEREIEKVAKRKLRDLVARNEFELAG